MSSSPERASLLLFSPDGRGPDASLVLTLCREGEGAAPDFEVARDGLLCEHGDLYINEGVGVDVQKGIRMCVCVCVGGYECVPWGKGREASSWIPPIPSFLGYIFTTPPQPTLRFLIA